VDRIMLIGSGRSEAFGTPEDVFDPGILSKVFQVDLAVSRDPVTGSWVIVPLLESDRI